MQAGLGDEGRSLRPANIPRRGRSALPGGPGRAGTPAGGDRATRLAALGPGPLSLSARGGRPPARSRRGGCGPPSPTPSGTCPMLPGHPTPAWGVEPDRFRSAEDLARLPVLERADLCGDPERFVCERARRRPDLLHLRSTGHAGMPSSRSSTTPGAVFQNAVHAERDRAARAAVVRQRRGYRQTLVDAAQGAAWRPAIATWKRARCCRERFAIQPQGPCRFTIPLEDTASRLDAFRPDVVRTQGSYLALLSPGSRHERRPCHLPGGGGVRRRWPS